MEKINNNNRDGDEVDDKVDEVDEVDDDEVDDDKVDEILPKLTPEQQQRIDEDLAIIQSQTGIDLEEATLLYQTYQFSVVQAISHYFDQESWQKEKTRQLSKADLTQEADNSEDKIRQLRQIVNDKDRIFAVVRGSN